MYRKKLAVVVTGLTVGAAVLLALIAPTLAQAANRVPRIVMVSNSSTPLTWDADESLALVVRQFWPVDVVRTALLTPDVIKETLRFNRPDLNGCSERFETLDTANRVRHFAAAVRPDPIFPLLTRRQTGSSNQQQVDSAATSNRFCNGESNASQTTGNQVCSTFLYATLLHGHILRRVTPFIATLKPLTGSVGNGRVGGWRENFLAQFLNQPRHLLEGLPSWASRQVSSPDT